MGAGRSPSRQQAAALLLVAAVLCSTWKPTLQQPAASPVAATPATSSNTAATATQTTAAATPAAPPTTPAAATQTTAAATPAAPVPAKPAAKKNKQVELAPEADVQNDIDDIDVQGKCKEFLSSSVCKDVEAGEGGVANCISEAISAAEAGEEGAENVPDDCQEDVYQFMITRGKNINANIPLAKACKADAEKLCKNTWVFGPTAEGRIIACLREDKDKLSKACKAEVYKVQMAVATDYRADPEMAALCKADIEQYCKGVKDGGGRVTACLRSTRAQLKSECAEAVFRQELEADEDLRLNIVVYRKCLSDKKRFCPDVAPGSSRARDCLVSARHEDGFSPACRDELEAMIEARVHDFRIDARLRRACKDQMQDCVGMDIYEGDETIVNICLQDNLAQGLIPDGACKNMVYEYQQLAAQDIRFDVPLADACHDDRQKLCGNVPPGSARVIRCLQTQREKLSSHCRAEMFNEEVRFSENIDFQFPMKQACLTEMDRYCKDVPHGQGRVIRWVHLVGRLLLAAAAAACLSHSQLLSAARRCRQAAGAVAAVACVLARLFSIIAFCSSNEGSACLCTVCV
eukprot:GHRQ01010403.1.p1 GENE.GHRQ01010403.1~~GHRQ01010403.1.p1  ORF type:complete len:576 (+),score=223.19 GHRQ01010403.1:287-2014(+)